MLSLVALSVFAGLQRPLPIDRIVPHDTKPTFLLGGFKFLEGPVWIKDDHLIWSDILADTIFELKAGVAVPLIKPSRRAIGNALDPQGRIVSCQQETRSVVRYEKNGTATILADRFDGKRFNTPDDVVVRSDGTIYFTDPGFGLKDSDRELAFNGVYKISLDGSIELLLRNFGRPNGLAFSPDEKLLYINDTVKRQIHVYDVDAAGEISNDKLFALITGEMAGQANGMKVDEKGNVYTTAPGGIQIFSREGQYLGLIFLPEIINNFCFGGVDGKTLYIATTQNLFKLPLKVAGARFKHSKG